MFIGYVHFKINFYFYFLYLFIFLFHVDISTSLVKSVTTKKKKTI